MRLRNFAVFITIAACLSLVWPTAGQCIGRFVLIGENSNYTYYLDTETVRYIPDPYRDEKLVDAWIRLVPTETGRQLEIKTRQADNLDILGYDDFGYSMRRFYFRTMQRQIQRMHLKDFSATDKPLETRISKYEAVRWEDIVPNTPPDEWYIFIMKFMENKSNDSGKGVVPPQGPTP